MMRAARQANMGKISKDVKRQNNVSDYQVSRFNAVKHGILSKHTVLSWEDKGEYDELYASLIDEHRPSGITEAHLVEEIAGVIWRKRRLRLAEAAVFRQGLRDAVVKTTSYDSSSNLSAAAALVASGGDQNVENDAVVKAIHADPKSTVDEIREFRALLKKADRALALLQDGGSGAYDKALKALDASTHEWWKESIEVTDGIARSPYSATADDLAMWVEAEAMVYFQKQLHVLTNRDVIREQTIGDAFDPYRFEPLARYETHLDRKFERTLAMLVKLQELRRDRDVRVLMASTADEESSGSSDTA